MTKTLNFLFPNPCACITKRISKEDGFNNARQKFKLFVKNIKFQCLKFKIYFFHTAYLIIYR